MEIKILGSGGGIPTPRAFCECKNCEKARKGEKNYKRNSSSLFIEEAKTIIDAPEDIMDSVNRENLKRSYVQNVFITHWHPDHAFGIRALLEANYDFLKKEALNVINLYISKKVYKDLKEKYNVLDHLKNFKKVVKIHFFENGNSINLGDIKITSVGYNGNNSDIYGYLIEKKQTKVLYTPCDTINFKNFLPEFFNLDLFITECGLFSHKTIKSEISFPDLMKRINKLKPAKTLITHIEEVELQKWGNSYLKKMTQKYPNVDFEFAFDGMTLDI